MATSPTVTAVADGLPSPYVDVLISDFPSGTFTYTLWRTVKGRRFKVRGMVGALAAGGATIRDYEAPFAVESSYQVEWFATTGVSSGFSTPSTVTIDWPYGARYDTAWFHDPLDPSSAVKVSMRGGAGPELVRETDADTMQVPSRSVGISFPGTRSGVRGAALDCYTGTRADGEAFDALFGGYDSDALAIVCVRTHPITWFPPTFFAFVGAPHLIPRGYAGEEVDWALSGDETTPPTPAVITPLLTYADFTAFYDTYADFTAAYPTYLDASRDYTIAGA